VRASREPFVRIEQLPAAELDWRVRAVFQDSSKSDWSSPRKLRVLAVDEEETLPPPNELFDPTIAPQPSPSASPSAFWLDLLKRILISSAHAESPPAPERYQVQLKWTPVKGASKYRVQISKSRAFRDPKDTLIEVQTEAPQWVWEYERGMENSKGRVFYRVASVSASGKVGNFSSPKPIDLRVAAKPVVETPLKAKVPAALQTFDATENASASEAVDALAVHEESRRKQATDTGLVSVAELEAPTTSAPSSQWSFSLGVGAAGQSQSGDGSLASVAFGSPYLQQHWELEGMTAPRNQSRWTARLVGNVASFERGASDSDPRMPEQPEVAAFRLRLDVLRETPDVSRGVQWALGLSLDRAYRWQKTGLQTVDAVNSISAGPGLWGSARLGSEGRLNAMLTVPALGLLIGQHASATGSLSADWPVWKLSESWVSARVQFEGTYMMWNRPLPTRATNWAFWIAPTLHLGSSDRKGGS
jgi:hypothetical protein